METVALKLLSFPTAINSLSLQNPWSDNTSKMGFRYYQRLVNNEKQNHFIKQKRRHYQTQQNELVAIVRANSL